MNSTIEYIIEDIEGHLRECQELLGSGEYVDEFINKQYLKGTINGLEKALLIVNENKQIYMMAEKLKKKLSI